MANERAISIVTPFHNVEMEYFNECVKSMRNQTIGFEKIEWIIVLHNCEPQYYPMLKEMFADDSNVVLSVLNDNFRTPSAPRNHGIKQATAPVLGFLDGDDRYTENCLETVVRELEETDSDMVNVRRESIVASEKVFRINCLSSFNGAVCRNIVESGHWTSEMFDRSSWGYSTSYFYKTALLRDNGLSFDTSFVFAEDFFFVLQCILNARRICYLNQLIGYVYLQNEQSILQSIVKPASVVMNIVGNYKHLLEMMSNHGIEKTQFLPEHLAGISGYIINSPDLTYEQRVEIKSMLEEEILSYSLDSKDMSSVRETMERMSTIYAVILSPENTLEKMNKQAIDGLACLGKILMDNYNTDFGKRNSFNNLKTIASYRNRTPLTDDAFYKPLLDLNTRVGEESLLTNEKVVLYMKKKDGSLIPATSTHIRLYDDALKEMLNGYHNLWVAQSHPIFGIAADGAELDNLYSALVKRYFSCNYFSQGTVKAKFMAPVEVFFSQKEEYDYRTLALYALADAEIDQIAAFRTTHIEKLFNYIENNWQSLLPEVHCCEARKAELKAVFEQGFGQPVAPRLWKGLKRVVAYGAGELYEHTAAMKRYTGDVPHNHGYYLTPEIILGKAVADESDLFECMHSIAFYELLPLQNEKAETLLWTQVERDKPYTLVITNKAGLYRYVTDHIICPKEVSKEHIYYTIY